MCDDRCSVKVRVKIPADLSSTGRTKWKRTYIDRCIAPLVEALQRGGIDMRGCCCGHGKADGWIELADGRVMVLTCDRQWLAKR